MEMICVSGLEFTYPSTDNQTIKGLDFVVDKGEIFGFLGPSGAGKSTTQKIIIGLLKNYSGQISVLGKNHRGLDSDYYERIGVSFEFPNHYLKLTAMENLTYFGSLYNSKTINPKTLLESVGLAKDAHLRVSQYSKGMKVRLGIARALLNDPELLFLDEPTTGLDPVNAAMVRDLMKEKKAEGKTVFLTTHNMNEADQICDRVAFIVDGQIRLIDSPRELKLRYGKREIRVEYFVDGKLEEDQFALGGLGENERFLDILKQRKIQTIHTQETTLENIFIQVTGHSLG